MEEQRPPKRPRTVARGQASDGDPREPDHPGVEPGDPGEAHGPLEPDRPAVPIAFMNPTRPEAPVHTEAARSAERGHRPRRPPQAERAHTQRQSRSAERGSHLETGSQEGLEHSQEPNVHGQVVGHEEPGYPGPRWIPPFFIAAPIVQDNRVPGIPSTQPAGAIQEPPRASGSWAISGQQISAIYPCIAFIPLPGSPLRFVETPSGTHVFGFPVFFTNIGR